MINVESWTVQSFQGMQTNGMLRISPEFQRRSVWNQKTEMLLVDSIARAIPIGAVTLYADESGGFDVYEVIDGKQRLSALMKYFSGDLVVKTALITSASREDDDVDPGGDELALAYHNVKFEDLDVPRKMAFLQYKVPVFVVRGPRSAAIRAFTRMNQNSYSLRPQEIRNAFFSDSRYLAAALQVTSELEVLDAGPEPVPFFMSLGIVSREGYARMQDVQLASELILLILQGPQERRDKLDAVYDLYRNPSGPASRELTNASDRVVKIANQIRSLAEGVALQGYHFPSACEHDFYALVGALHAHGPLSDPQMAQLRQELMDVISGFRKQVEEFVSRVRGNGVSQADEFSPLVESYGRGFLGGQVNSKDRRTERIRIWIEVIAGVAASLDPRNGFSDPQRRLIWARSDDKSCARCGETVEWKDFHAGHKIPHSLGGQTRSENGQVEHGTCNQAAGAS